MRKLASLVRNVTEKFQTSSGLVDRFSAFLDGSDNTFRSSKTKTKEVRGREEKQPSKPKAIRERDELARFCPAGHQKQNGCERAPDSACVGALAVLLHSAPFIIGQRAALRCRSSTPRAPKATRVARTSNNGTTLARDGFHAWPNPLALQRPATRETAPTRPRSDG